MLLSTLQLVLIEHLYNACVPVILILYTLWNSFLLHRSRPQNVSVEGRSLVWGKWWSTWDFVVRGSDRIAAGYRKSRRRPFAIAALREYLVLISDPAQIDEVARSPENVLSFHAAMNDRLRHQITMMGFEHGDIDPDEYVTMRAIKVHLRRSLGELQPSIARAVASGFDKGLEGAKSDKGIATVPLFSLVKNITSQVNNQVFFGDELSSNKAFAQAALRYSWDGSMTAEICRYFPQPLAPLVGRALMAYTGTMREVEDHLKDLVQRRLEESALEVDADHLDVLQFVIESSRTPAQREPTRLVQMTAALLFAVSLTLPMALYWAILNLCVYPQHTQALRDEIHHAEEKAGTLEMKDLRLLGSFLRESGRMNPPDALTIQRKVVRPFTFLDGTHLPTGNLVAIPQQAIMRDSQYYRDPEQFDPYRFFSPADPESEAAVQKFTDVKLQYPYWGSPQKSCPGRWYASDVLKQAMVYFLKNFEFELIEPANRQPLKFTTALAPRIHVAVSLKSRSTQQAHKSCC